MALLPADAARQLARQIQLNSNQVVIKPESIQIPHDLNRAAQQYPPYYVGYTLTNGRKVPDTVAVHIPSVPADDQTSPHPYQDMDEDSLHPLLFQLEPSPDPLGGVRTVPRLVNRANGQVERGENGRELRYFSFLPRYISRRVSGMLLELWFRLDPRLRTSDVLDRMSGVRDVKKEQHSSEEDDIRTRDKVPLHNAINMRRVRFRSEINTPSFLTGRQRPTRIEVDNLSTLTEEQVLLNTCMRVDTQRNILLQPIIGHPSTNHDKKKTQNTGNREVIAYINSGLPLDYFLRPYAGAFSKVPSDRMHAAIALRRRLQTLAVAQDPTKNNRDDYRSLDRDDEPTWWHDRKRDVTNIGRPIRELPGGETHLEWMDRVMDALVSQSASGNTQPSQRDPSMQPPDAANSSNKKRKVLDELTEDVTEEQRPAPKRSRSVRKHYRSNINLRIDTSASQRNTSRTYRSVTRTATVLQDTLPAGQRQSIQSADPGYWSGMQSARTSPPLSGLSSLAASTKPQNGIRGDMLNPAARNASNAPSGNNTFSTAGTQEPPWWTRPGFDYPLFPNTTEPWHDEQAAHPRLQHNDFSELQRFDARRMYIGTAMQPSLRRYPAPLPVYVSGSSFLGIPDVAPQMQTAQQFLRPQYNADLRDYQHAPRTYMQRPHRYASSIDNSQIDPALLHGVGESSALGQQLYQQQRPYAQNFPDAADDFTGLPEANH